MGLLIKACTRQIEQLKNSVLAAQVGAGLTLLIRLGPRFSNG